MGSSKTDRQTKQDVDGDGGNQIAAKSRENTVANTVHTKTKIEVGTSHGEKQICFCETGRDRDVFRKRKIVSEEQTQRQF